jgi:hypothetical protein
MHRFWLSVPCTGNCDQVISDFGHIIELARKRAHALDHVVYIEMEGAGPGCPNRWAVSPKGYLSVEGVQLPPCRGCG